MNRELIKEELIRRMSGKRHIYDGSHKTKISPLSALQGRLESTKPFVDDMMKTLNQILHDNNVEWQENEKGEFIEYITPTIKKLIKDQMLNR
ncbi:hypothetical protein [Ohtaekwangia koreensis]|uniref:Uncharacterized protein n=1 Tax=Ohtaekwangia koreensis TaxID=688867 RepID=A0A1T5JQN8_9BACT|nr:hypothetical protein [Ohtaekwangia koreensis]SKC53635.1 hypothetical protein SAMN05660236_1368 [Ohtaekwangia koreensis]